MKTRKILAVLTIIAVVIAMMPAMAFAEETPTNIAPAPAKSNDIVILATSDVHCAVDENIGYAGLAAYKKAMEEQYNYVALVDAGDAIQGGTIGTLSKGTYLNDIMNEMGYDVRVPGNHEFDYGMDQFLNEIAAKAKTEYVSCNFVDKDKKPVFKAYTMKDYGDKKVAFVGITTPETFFKSTPTYFQDKNGNYIYGFSEGNNGKDLYKAVQDTIDSAKTAGADYVVAVGHLGDDPASAPWTSSEVIANTAGLTAFIDGHAHMTFTKPVKDKAGKSVQVVSTGTKLENIGKLVIYEKGIVTATNVTAEEAAAKDKDMDAFVKKIQSKYKDLENKVVAKTSVKLRISDDNDNRLVRSEETNLGDLCADAYKTVLGADIAFVNGGGIRVNVDAGDITYGEIIAVHPFGNMACVVEATGQQIKDALEFGARNVGKGENGGFLQVSGLTYDINTFIEPSIEINDKGEFVKVTGEYRVSNIMVGGKELDLEKTYKLASHNYMLKQGGDGFVMFKGNKVIQDEVMIDNQVLITYIQDYLKGTVGSEYAQPQGRIKIISNEAFKTMSEKLEIAEYECTVKAKSTKSYVQLTWNACKADGVKYQIYRSTKSSSGFKKVYTTSKNSFKTTSLTKGKTYYFKVRAIKTIDGSTYYGHYSNKVSGKKAA